jgi:hypothetical protein
MMQPQPGQASFLELADRRLVDAREGLHGPLRQSRPTTPFVCFAADPNQLICHLRLEQPRLSVHRIHSTRHRLPDDKPAIRDGFAASSPALSAPFVR